MLVCDLESEAATAVEVAEHLTFIREDEPVSDTLLVNLFAGPGTGKSTTAAHVFAELKWSGINCELVTEYAKDKVWEKSFGTLDNQLYVLGKQYHKLARVRGQVEVIVTDSPLLLSLVYGRGEGVHFKNLVLSKHKEFDNFNVFLRRKKKFVQAGRTQTKSEAEQLDTDIIMMLVANSVPFEQMPAERGTVDQLVEHIKIRIRPESVLEAGPCGCECHYEPGVFHVAPCCSAPPADNYGVKDLITMPTEERDFVVGGPGCCGVDW